MNTVTNSGTPWDLKETEQSELNVLVLSAEQFRGDLIGAGIRNSVIGTANNEDLLTYDPDEEDSEAFNPNIVLIDLSESSSVESGMSIGRKMIGRGRHPAIIVLASTREILAQVRVRLVDVDPRWSFLTSDSISGLPDLIRIIESAAAGMTIVDPGFFPGVELTDQFLTRPLTRRQIDVLSLLSQGYNNDSIGEQLDIAARTVEFHLQEAYTAIKDCHSSQYNPRVYAAKIFLDHFVQTDLAKPTIWAGAA